ncbi:GntR family transcriptional regulator [Microbacterium bovistercoris]|uniref:GntR family transcriptional regulator n=1 Tax=Microbacterium bovistercoris TaxID=2293570 RepID=A0A371NSL7_9MICO|nr:GntR family transcriptional regulator [Microbacterium bovistercoris]REJ05154.1 GntR family transcriptional regulator [Microbacterium bovistercoris]
MTVYESLRTLVMTGGIREDERVAESQLAERLGVSRTPVREALQRLEGDGLVRAQGRGIRLRLLSDVELAQLHEARAGLEGSAAFQAAQRVARGEVAPVRLEALTSLAAETNGHTLSGDLARAIEANRAFHEAVAALADNPVISSTLSGWWDQITISTRRSLGTPERAQAVHAEHEIILRALHNGDTEAARAAVEHHAFATREALRQRPIPTRSAS